MWHEKSRDIVKKEYEDEISELKEQFEAHKIEAARDLMVAEDFAAHYQRSLDNIANLKSQIVKLKAVVVYHKEIAAEHESEKEIQRKEVKDLQEKL